MCMFCCLFKLRSILSVESTFGLIKNPSINFIPVKYYFSTNTYYSIAMYKYKCVRMCSVMCLCVCMKDCLSCFSSGIPLENTLQSNNQAIPTPHPGTAVRYHRLLKLSTWAESIRGSVCHTTNTLPLRH